MKSGQEVEFLLEKIRRRLHHWTNRCLSFASRAVLLKHVLCAMPMYYFLSMSLDPKGYKLEGVCRSFLWGRSTGGRASRRQWPGIGQSLRLVKAV